MNGIDGAVAANARLMRVLPWLILTRKEATPATVKARSVA